MREMLLGAYIRQKRLELGLTRQQGGKFFHIRGPSVSFLFQIHKTNEKGPPQPGWPLCYFCSLT